ncbi:PD-(D/E)XK nuclease family protein [Legionella cardiaca]|uniref:PD-(D/E)XK nuclease family protein n=1 Tax=Legionella cardiaca TaxID=1071983 RepID=A0ABY8ASK9_9GAMM|nr:PD-(D/E)XK nuclease family protein [Legionella cardiaca]WED42162.1 PD-(D/E)XK nuclease family protein [Legionella cardiaca]
MNKDELLKLMQAGAVVITPNNRLSNELLKDFLHAFPQTVQEKPSCLPYSAFLLNSFQKFCHREALASHPILLTTQQLHHLWRQILSSEVTVNRGLLQAVEEAWTRSHLWLLDFDHPAFAYTQQTRRFQQWVQQLTQELQRLGAITEVQLVPYLCAQKNSFDSKTIIWACFDDYTPQQKKLQHYLSAQDCKNYHYDLSKKQNRVYHYAAQNEIDEYEQLLYWLQECLDKGKTRIGVVIPDLQAQSSILQRNLQRHISPTQFNISLGKPLAEYPLVAHALEWLYLDGKILNLHQARLLLHSPYLAYSQTELLARAEFMENNATLKETHFSQLTFIQALKSKAPKLANLLQKIVSYPEEASVETWIRHFYERLLTLGFPGERSLNSEMYQCYQRFLMLFDEFKQFALITERMNKTDALTAFKELAESIIFQAQKSSTPIQILGLLEASGCTFESLWVTGLTDQCLPKNAKLSAFIPVSLQREYLMPHADPTRELYLAEKTLTRLQNASDLTIFSYPQLSDDKPNMASPLIAEFMSFSRREQSTPLQHSKLECFSENYSLPLISEERIVGGTAILANQAKCPFRAFAAHRLHAKSSVAAADGPDAKERGQLIHKVMELLWGTLKTQAYLLQLNESQLNAHIENAIKVALEPIITQRSYSFSELIQEVELDRLKQLVHACLDWERQRPPFTVEAIEQAFTINLGDMDFKVRVDRLDKMENGQKWVIDYKTSLPQSLPWNEERPKEPQLLLYALLDDTINTLLFTQLKAGQLTPKGLSEDKLAVSGISTLKKGQSWTELRQHWQDQLNELAHEFLKGHSPPQPGSPAICQQCDYQNLCRFNTQE